jgi:hypothetical protein
MTTSSLMLRPKSRPTAPTLKTTSTSRLSRSRSPRFCAPLMAFATSSVAMQLFGYSGQTCWSSLVPLTTWMSRFSNLAESEDDPACMASSYSKCTVSETEHPSAGETPRNHESAGRLHADTRQIRCAGATDLLTYSRERDHVWLRLRPWVSRTLRMTRSFGVTPQLRPSLYCVSGYLFSLSARQLLVGLEEDSTMLAV